MKNKRFITLTELYNKYMNNLNEKYDYYENMRLKKIKDIKVDVLCIFIFCSFGIILAIILYIISKDEIYEIASQELLTFGIYWLISHTLLSIVFIFIGKIQYRKLIKKHLLPLLLGNIKNLRKNIDIKPREEETSPFNITNNACTMYDDSFIGMYNNAFFKISEIYNIKPYYLSNGISQGYKVMEGIICTFDINKKFSNTIKLSNKPFPSIKPKIANLIGYLLIILTFIFELIIVSTMRKGAMLLSLSFALILLFCMIMPTINSFIWKIIVNIQNSYNNRGFMDNFKITAENENEARSIITPAFMKIIKYLRKKFKGNTLECIIKNKRIMLYIKTNKDCFEIWDVNKTIDDKKSIQNFYFELTALLRIIDYFESK